MQVNNNVSVPVGASANGRRNSFVVYCDVMMHAKLYAVCLNICGKVDEGNPPAQYSDCVQAMKVNACAARGMRKEEIEKGHAIYFREREVMAVAEAPRSEFVPTAKSPVTHTAKPEPVSSKVRDSAPVVRVQGYADAINRALEAHKTAKPEAVPGESLLDMAKRLINS